MLYPDWMDAALYLNDTFSDRAMYPMQLYYCHALFAGKWSLDEMVALNVTELAGGTWNHFKLSLLVQCLISVSA